MAHCGSCSPCKPVAKKHGSILPGMLYRLWNVGGMVVLRSDHMRPLSENGDEVTVLSPLPRCSTQNNTTSSSIVPHPVSFIATIFTFPVCSKGYILFLPMSARPRVSSHVYPDTDRMCQRNTEVEGRYGLLDKKWHLGTCPYSAEQVINW